MDIIWEVVIVFHVNLIICSSGEYELNATELSKMVTLLCLT